MAGVQRKRLEPAHSHQVADSGDGGASSAGNSRQTAFRQSVLQAMRADSDITHGDAPEMSGQYSRNVVLVEFQPSVSQAERTAILVGVGGSVLGGFRLGVDGVYYVKLDGPGNDAALRLR